MKKRPPEGGTPNIALLGHHELFHRYEQRRRVGKVIASRPVDSFLDLKSGDYVVHVAHGIAKFTGMQTISKDGHSEEYLTLRFADSATLHVPAARINLIQKYVGNFSGHPQLSRLGSGSWEKQKAKVAEAVMDMAAELLEIQAARAAEPGQAYPPDTDWQREFEAEFPYEPTHDQVVAAEEIKQDMQRPRPMDRLLCGDVGYGKTEMAMRSPLAYPKSFKCPARLYWGDEELVFKFSTQRLAKKASAAGLDVQRVEVGRDGRISVVTAIGRSEQELPEGSDGAEIVL